MSFTFIASAADWARIAPELVLIGMTLLVMITDLLLPQTGRTPKERGAANFLVLPLVSLLGIAGALAATILLFVFGDGQRAFFGMIGSDWGSLYAYLIILSASGLGILLSPAYLKRLNLVHQGEYYALMLLATTGMLLMAAATSFMMVFVGLELLSLALYILCGFVTRRPGSQESSMKYFLLSSFASAFLLYGIAMIYGATGSTSFAGVSQFLTQSGSHHTVLLIVGIGLLIVGFAFKISAVPFQAWTPDVYDGAPAPVTAFMSVGTKAAALIAFARVFVIVLHPVQGEWREIIWAITILTIVGGNILALVQSNVKRLLAYSSIAHAGYLLIGVVAGSTGSRLGLSAILFYLFCYTFLNLGAFGVVSVLERADNTGSSLSDLRGLWYRRPVLAALLAFFLLSLAGFPPMAGFAAKYYLFYTALVSGYPELLIIGVLASILGMYYYLKIIAAMFMEREKEVVVSNMVSASTLPPIEKRVSGKLGKAVTPSARGGTAVAVKTPAVAKTTAVIESVVETEKAATIGWTTGTALAITVAGALLAGTVLAFWLVDLAVRAAGMM
ncbi:MAG: NADH-quinone oxidoreductase subunit N [Ktedonobacteraceae bacterium]|nr:NADH-quinone oxidoreductase subunit N [Ktedonobacteraceae bacterium]